MVHIKCSNPELSVRYTANGAEPDSSAHLYEKPFPLKDGGTVKARPFINEMNCGEIRSCGISEVTFGCDRSDWKVLSVSLESPFKNGGFADSEHLLNDDPSTYWHTYHTDISKSAAPHEVVLDMGQMRKIAAFTFLPRGAEGTPDQYEFHLSRDGKSWKLAVAGHFEGLKADAGMRLVKLDTPMTARYLRFIAKHVLDDVDYVVVAGIGAVESKKD
jgi:alpha-L-fucosidase